MMKNLARRHPICLSLRVQVFTFFISFRFNPIELQVTILAISSLRVSLAIRLALDDVLLGLPQRHLLGTGAKLESADGLRDIAGIGTGHHKETRLQHRALGCLQTK